VIIIDARIVSADGTEPVPDFESDGGN